MCFKGQQSLSLVQSQFSGQQLSFGTQEVICVCMHFLGEPEQISSVQGSESLQSESVMHSSLILLFSLFLDFAGLFVAFPLVLVWLQV